MSVHRCMQGIGDSSNCVFPNLVLRPQNGCFQSLLFHQQNMFIYVWNKHWIMPFSRSKKLVVSLPHSLIQMWTVYIIPILTYGGKIQILAVLVLTIKHWKIHRDVLVLCCEALKPIACRILRQGCFGALLYALERTESALCFWALTFQTWFGIGRTSWKLQSERVFVTSAFRVPRECHRWIACTKHHELYKT